MLVDPFTIIAQAINFLILAAVLKFVLYDRVVAIIDQRQARIAERIERADRREVAAADEQERYERLRDDLEEQRGDLLAAAREQADDRRRELIDEARDEVEELRRQWLAGLERERTRLLKELERRAADEVLELGEQTLRDLADAELEDQVIEVALRRLTDRRDDLAAELGSAEHVTVRTAYDLDDARRARIAEHLGELLRHDVEVEVERAADLICGLEVRAGDHAFGWNVAGYLGELRRRVDVYLDEQIRTEEGDDDARRAPTATGEAGT